MGSERGEGKKNRNRNRVRESERERKGEGEGEEWKGEREEGGERWEEGVMQDVPSRFYHLETRHESRRAPYNKERTNQKESFRSITERERTSTVLGIHQEP